MPIWAIRTLAAKSNSSWSSRRMNFRWRTHPQHSPPARSQLAQWNRRCLYACVFPFRRRFSCDHILLSGYGRHHTAPCTKKPAPNNRHALQHLPHPPQSEFASQLSADLTVPQILSVSNCSKAVELSCGRINSDSSQKFANDVCRQYMRWKTCLSTVTCNARQ